MSAAPLLAPACAAASTASVDVDPGAIVRVYGAAGTFGGLDHRAATPTGEALTTAPVPGWGFLPGQSAYFPAIAPDGTIVIANEPQTDNQLRPTARQMALTTFDPATLRFANTVVPTSTGLTELGGPWPAASSIVGGGDVSDVGVIRAGSSTRVVFTSAMPFWGWASGGGEYPTLGVLAQNSDGGWSVDRRRSRTASDLAVSAGRAERARIRMASRKSRKARRAAHAAAAATGDACVTRSYPGMDTYGDCRMPAEFAQLPASQGLVVTQYAFDDPDRPSGRLSVLDPVRGNVLASYAYPSITAPDGGQLAVHPREVVADPYGRSGAERFVVIFDAERGVGDAGAPSVAGAMQEFAYDAKSGTLTPLSAPILTGDRAADGTPLGFETATYDARGDLWAGQSQVGTLQAGALAVYRRTSRGTVLAGRSGCSVSSAWRGQAWGRTCAPDVRIGEAAGLGIARSLDPLPGGTVVLSTMSGRVLAVRRTADGGLAAGRSVDLGLDLLADRSTVRIGPRKAAYDRARHLLWIPIQQLATDRTCASWPCPPQVLDQWLVAVDVTRLG
ncbi:MAG: hypothetical protein J7513_01405 [Solirubrobacteraceae bacterium]|nr:hypothetical protein [Solirubrobacteraceae bacterium]